MNTSRLRRGENDAYTWCTNNGEFGKQLIKEFNNEKNTFTLQDITYSSHIKAIWTCSNGHDFEMTYIKIRPVKYGFVMHK